MGLPEFIESPSQNVHHMAEGHTLFALLFGDGLKR